MKEATGVILVTRDNGLAAHWKRAFGSKVMAVASGVDAISGTHLAQSPMVWIDLACPQVLLQHVSNWSSLLENQKLIAVAASSNPKEDEAMELLDSGFMGYCHAYSDVGTLKQVREVVQSGNIWIGKNLMQRLLRRVSSVKTARVTPDLDWSLELTPRERQVAILAANGATNQAIALQCAITERTVKAHLGTVFQKLNITDRLQLALRVHGIH
jgi:DNA-binding NarL/FixJ family response regulator